MKLIQVSDIHIVEPGKLLFGISPGERLAQCVRHINARHEDAFVCVLSGDLVNNGRVEEYRELQRLLDELHVPYLPMVGNHDHRQHLQEVLGTQPTTQGGFLQQAVRTPEATLLFLDTVEAGADWGRYCEVRLAWLEAQLAAAEHPAYLFMHHPPVAIGHRWLDGIGLRDDAPFRAVLQRHRQRVAHVFFGHVHRAYFGVHDGISYSAVPACVHQVSLAGMERGDLWGCYEPPAYGLILIGEDGLRLHYQPFLESPLFDFGEH